MVTLNNRAVEDICVYDLPPKVLAVITRWPWNNYNGTVVVRIDNMLYDINEFCFGKDQCARWANLFDTKSENCRVRILSKGESVTLIME